jgi:hypothetical protein
MRCRKLRDAHQHPPLKSEIVGSCCQEGAMNNEINKGSLFASIIAALAVIGVLGVLYAPLIAG